MALTTSLRAALNTMFWNNLHPYPEGIHNTSLYCDSLHEDNIIMPLCIVPSVKKYCEKHDTLPGRFVKTTNIKKFYPTHYKTPAAVLNYILRANHANVIMDHVSYVGDKHYIFMENEDKLLIPLMIPLVSIDLIRHDNNYKIENIKILLGINKNIFWHNDKVSAYIAKNVVPYISSNRFSVEISFTNYGMQTPDILFTDLDRFIQVNTQIPLMKKPSEVWNALEIMKIRRNYKE